MYKKVHKKESERNEDQVYSVKLALDKMKKIIKNVSENRKFMIEENEKIIDIVERILYFNQQDQSGQGLKILTPNQMLSRLPISLAQLKEEIILRNLKTKLGYFCILCTDRKSLQKMSIII